MTDHRIEPGDLFYKPWGHVRLVRLFLPRKDSSPKRHYVRMSSKHRSVDSTYNRTHAELETQGYTFAGNVLTRSSPVGASKAVYEQWEYEARRYLDSAV